MRASTLVLSVPSIALNSASDIPEKFGGGWGGGTVKGMKGNGGNMKGGLGPPAGDPAVAPGDVLEAVLEVGAVDCPIVVVVAPV